MLNRDINAEGKKNVSMNMMRIKTNFVDFPRGTWKTVI